MRISRMIFGVFALSLASTSCLRPAKTQARVFTPPPARPARTVPDTTPQLPAAPQIAADQASIVPPLLPTLTPDTMPEVPEAPKRVVRRTTPPVVSPKPPPVVTPPVEAAPVPPKLAQMYTPEEQRENTRTLDEYLGRVDQELAKLDGKNLTAEQKETVLRIRTLRKQAEQAREQDLLTAVSLAKRADLFAKDLLEHLP
jgi:hypothetical protein